METAIKKILIIRFSSLGDVLLTTPIVRALSNKYPAAKLDFVVKEQSADIYRFNSRISQLIVFDKNLSGEIASKIAAEGYDLIIDLQNNWRSRRLTHGINCRISRFNKPTLKKILLVWFKINLLKEKKSIVQRYADAVPSLHLDDLGLELNMPADTMPKLAGEEKYIGFCPGSKHYTKMWPQEYFVELGKILTEAGYKVVLFGGASDESLCKLISGLIPGSINFQNDNKLHQIAADMKMCEMIITNDSGLMHVAAAANVPVIAIFGSTVREFGFSPYKVKNLILENNYLSCRPCSHIGRANCPKDHFKCMKELTPQLAYKHILNLLPQK